MEDKIDDQGADFRRSAAWQLTVLAYALAVNYQTEDSILLWDR